MSNARPLRGFLFAERGGCDRLIWPITVDGCNSVKSGYYEIKATVMRNVYKVPSSSHCINSMVWKVIWHLDIPMKIRNFL